MGTCASKLTASSSTVTKKSPNKTTAAKRREREQPYLSSHNSPPQTPLPTKAHSEQSQCNPQHCSGGAEGDVLFDPIEMSVFGGKWRLEATKAAIRQRAQTTKKRIDPSDYEAIALPPRSLFLRRPGEVNGERITVCDNKQCDIILLDHCDSVALHACEGCFVFIGPTSGSVFVEGCRDCVIVSCSAQIRLRQCRRLQLCLAVGTQPALEESREIGLCALSGWFQYPLMAQHMRSAGLSMFNNAYSTPHDFTPKRGAVAHGGGGNFYYMNSNALEVMSWVRCRLALEVWGGEARAIAQGNNDLAMEKVKECKDKDLVDGEEPFGAALNPNDVHLAVAKEPKVSTTLDSNKRENQQLETNAPNNTETDKDDDNGFCGIGKDMALQLQVKLNAQNLLSCSLPLLPIEDDEDNTNDTYSKDDNNKEKRNEGDLRIQNIRGAMDLYRHAVTIPFTYGAKRLYDRFFTEQWRLRLFVVTADQGGAWIATRIVRDIELARRHAFLKQEIHDTCDPTDEAVVHGPVLLLNTAELRCTATLVRDYITPTLEDITAAEPSSHLAAQGMRHVFRHASQRMTGHDCLFLLTLLRPSGKPNTHGDETKARDTKSDGTSSVKRHERGKGNNRIGEMALEATDEGIVAEAWNIFTPSAQTGGGGVETNIPRSNVNAKGENSNNNNKNRGQSVVSAETDTHRIEPSTSEEATVWEKTVLLNVTIPLRHVAALQSCLFKAAVSGSGAGNPHNMR